MKQKVSAEVDATANKIAKATQKPGQTKEQSKIIAQGIAKGIAEYKKQQGKKLREIDKQRKQQQKVKPRANEQHELTIQSSTTEPKQSLPWILLAISWLGFVMYLGYTHFVMV